MSHVIFHLRLHLANFKTCCGTDYHVLIQKRFELSGSEGACRHASALRIRGAPVPLSLFFSVVVSK